MGDSHFDTRNIPRIGSSCFSSGGLFPQKVMEQIDDSGTLKAVFDPARAYL